MVIAGAPSFLRVWTGLTVSLLGSALTSFALGIRIFQQTGSATQYSLVMFCAALPPLVVLPLAGPLVDRFPRKSMLLACDVVGALAAATLALLAWKGALNLAGACPLVMAIAGAAALQAPTYSATVPLLVPAEQLGKASGMTQLAEGMAQVGAPLLAGALIGPIGLAGIAAIDVATFLFSMAMLLLAAIPRVAAEHRARPAYGRDLAVGWRWIAAHAGHATLLVMFALTNFFAELASVLFTPFVLAFGTPAALGTIVSTGGVGLLAGGAAMTVTGGPRRPARGAVLFAAAGGVVVAAAAFTRSVPLLAAIVATFFFFLPLTAGSSQVVWQRTVPKEIQGRVFAARAAIAMSIMPLASLTAGPLADRVFAPAMAEGGRGAAVFGPLIGTGAGRGIALLFVACGALIVVIALASLASAPLRRLDGAEILRGAAPEPDPLVP